MREGRRSYRIDPAMRPSSERVRPIMRRRDPALIEAVVAGVVAGDLKWVVSADYPFEDARSAYQAILARHVRGESVLTF